MLLRRLDFGAMVTVYDSYQTGAAGIVNTRVVSVSAFSSQRLCVPLVEALSCFVRIASEA